MKRIIAFALCACLLVLSVGTLTSCTETKENRREDGSLYLEGIYAHESGTSEDVFAFTKDLLVLFRIVDTETVEFHFDYNIVEKEDKMELTITYKGLVYGGSDPNVSTYVTGMRVNFAKNPTQTDPLEIGDGYIVVGGKKLLKQ